MLMEEKATVSIDWETKLMRFSWNRAASYAASIVATLFHAIGMSNLIQHSFLLPLSLSLAG